MTTIKTLLAGRNTLQQYDILQRADVLFSGDIVFPEHNFHRPFEWAHPHCTRCYVPQGDGHALAHGGRCSVPRQYPGGRYYGGVLTPEEILYLDPPKQETPHCRK